MHNHNESTFSLPEISKLKFYIFDLKLKKEYNEVGGILIQLHNTVNVFPSRCINFY